MHDFEALWARIDGETLAGTWTAGSALVPTVEPAAPPRAALPRLDLEADFELGEVIGRGGNGVVIRARQRSLNQSVAIKVLADSAEGRAAAALLAEARAAGGLEHPNIVPIHALGRDADGRPVMVMKYLDGVSWATLLTQADHPIHGTLPPAPIDRQLHIVEQVVAAVACAHDAGVVHRDIKPANVMIGNGGEICLVDWGLARRAGDLAPGPAGTPGFMPPEMFSAQARVDPRTDVYLLGASLYAALVGEVPHPGLSLAEVMRGTLQPAISVPEDLPAELQGLLTRAMAPDPADRFASVAALRAALRAFADHRDADRLCAEAETHLDAITPDAVERATAFGAAQFGFEAALSRWPQSPRAQAGLDAARAAMFDAALAHDHLDNAASLLAALPPDPTRAAALASRRAAHAARTAEYSRLRDAEDSVRGRRGRRYLFPIASVVGVLLPLTLGVLRVSDKLDARGFPLQRAAGPIVAGLGLLALLRWSHRPGLRQAFNRRAFSVLALLLIAVGLNFVVGGLLGLTVPQITACNLLLSAFSSSLACVLLSPAFRLPALVGAVATVGAARWPLTGELWLAASNAVTLFALWRYWRMRAREGQAAAASAL